MPERRHATDLATLPADVLPLTRGDFAFHGFDGLEAALDDSLAAVGVRRGEPHLRAIDDAVYVPATKTPATITAGVGRYAVAGGLVTPDGREVDGIAARRHGSRWGTRVIGGVPDPAAVAATAAPRIDAEVVYLGWYFDHFGHFLLETLARAWALAAVDPTAKVLFHAPRDATPRGTRGRLLEELGIPPERVLGLDRPTRILRLLVPDALFEISAFAHERMPDPFRRLAARLVGEQPRTEQPVYVSRRLLPGHLRLVVGEGDLEDVLRENGFLVVHPETMAIEDQIAVLNRHRHIVTTAGSAAHAVLFARTAPALHLLSDGVPRQDYFLVPKVSNVPTTYVNALRRDERSAVNSRSPVLADLPAIVAYLDDRGFVHRRRRADFARRLPPNRPVFDEAWLYTAVADVLGSREALPAAILSEATRRAETSWPLAWILARYHAGRNEAEAEALAARFADLVSRERDLARLVLFADDVEGMARQVMNGCGLVTAAAVARAIEETFGIVPKRRGDRSVAAAATD
jgi:capsular polysaccharide biosynthesis protein